MPKISFHHPGTSGYEVLLDGKRIGFATRARDLGIAVEAAKETWWFCGTRNHFFGPFRTRREAAARYVASLEPREKERRERYGRQ